MKFRQYAEGKYLYQKRFPILIYKTLLFLLSLKDIYFLDTFHAVTWILYNLTYFSTCLGYERLGKNLHTNHTILTGKRSYYCVNSKTKCDIDIFVITNMTEKEENHKNLSNSSIRACSGARGYSFPAERLHCGFGWISWCSNQPISPACSGPLQTCYTWYIAINTGSWIPRNLLVTPTAGFCTVDHNPHSHAVQPSFHPSYHPLIQSITHCFNWKRLL